MKLFLLKLQTKEAFRLLPKFLLGMLIFSMLTIGVAYAASNMLYKNDAPVLFKVAAVLPEDDPLVRLGYNTIKSLETLEGYCEFVETTPEDGLKMLKSGEVYGLITIPFGFINDIMNGINTPATITLPGNAGFEATVFLQVIDSASDSLAYVQSGIYALSDTAYHFDAPYEEIAHSNEVINDAYVRLVLRRDGMFDVKTASVTGSLNRITFYACNLFIVLVLFVGITLGPFFNAEKNSTMLLLNRKGISTFYTTICKTIIISIFYVLLFGIILFGISSSLSKTDFEDYAPILNVASLLNLALIFIGIVSFTGFVFSLSGNEIYAVLLLFLLTVVMAFSSGLIVPAAYLPAAFSKLGNLLPTKQWAQLIYSLYENEVEFKTYMIYGLYTLSFILLTALNRRISMKNA